MVVVYGVKINVQVLAILQGPIVVCCGCSDGYHLSCCDPKVPDGTRSTEFVCSHCMPPTTRPSYGAGMLVQKPEDYFGFKTQAFGYILLYVGANSL